MGNRTQQTSTSPPITSGAFGYDADDRLTTDVYDANGNTINSGGQGITYDFENHILTENGATYLYDGDGNRVQKTVAGLNTLYTIVSVNPTGYPQVAYEQYTGSGTHDAYRAWALGLEREAQYRSYVANSQQQVEISYYVRDGHGSTRALTDPSGNVTDTYDYDAFGNLIHTSTTLSSPTPNEFLFAGEQYDTETGHYYNRARYLNTTTGRFMTMDRFDGIVDDPATLHKYLYVFADPTDLSDPTGNSAESVWGTLLHNQIYLKFRDYLSEVDHVGVTNASIALSLNLPEQDRLLEGAYARPDLVDMTAAEVYEIKPFWLYEQAETDIAYYIMLLDELDPEQRSWQPGTDFNATGEYTLEPGVVADVEPTEGGAILYTIRSLFPTFVPVDVFAEGEQGVASLVQVALAADEAELGDLGADIAVAPAF